MTSKLTKRLSKHEQPCHTDEIMNPAILAAAFILSRFHGVTFAALFLLDQGVDFRVIKELLMDELRVN